MRNTFKFYRHVVLWVIIFVLGSSFAPVMGFTQENNSPQFRRLAVETYRQKMKAGWLGQMVGVSFGGPTEFRYVRGIIPEQDMPTWHPGLMNNAFNEDNLYVEM